MGWATAIQAGTSLLGGRAARKGARAQGRAAQQGIDYTKGIYNQAQGNLSPYMQAGQGGLAGLAQANAGDYSGFMNSPDYLYARDQAQHGIEHGASAAGSLFSPGTQVELGKQLSGLASQNFGNWRNSQMDLARLGQGSAVSLGQLGMNAADGVSRGYGAQGNAKNSSYGALAGMFGSAGNALGGYFGSRGGGASAYGGGSNAGNFGLPAPVSPYQGTNYGSGSTGGWRW